ncbi:MAG: hypothetical protein M3R04_05465 [bacterium]|nr:hypothetical protein [bacterium]
MADNIAITSGAGTVIATDDIAGVQYQRVKLAQGADGVGVDVSSAAPLQVSLANHGANTVAVKVDASATTQPVSLASVPSHAVTNAGIFSVQVTDFAMSEFKTVPQSSTAMVLGATGALGDYLNGLLLIPVTTSPGAVTLIDNATSYSIFVGGASSVSNLVPFYVPVMAKSVSGAWKVTTGANISVFATGNFT